MSSPLEKPYLILVEGNDDKAFFDSFIEYVGGESLSSKIETKKVDGKRRFAEQIKEVRTLLKASGGKKIERLGLVRDYDETASGQENPFQSLCDALQAQGFTPPSRPFELSQGQPQTIICMMPPQKEQTGRMLEDLYYEAVQNDPAIPCITSYFDCLSAEGISIPDHHLPKSRLSAYLASRSDPGKRLVDYIKAHFDSSVFDPIRLFLQELIKPPST
jgi:hypothetical protein